MSVLSCSHRSPQTLPKDRAEIGVPIASDRARGGKGEGTEAIQKPWYGVNSAVVREGLRDDGALEL